MMRVLVLLIAFATFSGCSPSADSTAAAQAVSSFHELLDAGQFNQIYDLSADELKKATARSDFVALLDAEHRKLGNMKTQEQRGWSANYRPSGTFITLTYKTTFSEGEAVEQFSFRMQDRVAALAGYHVNSNALVIK